MKRVTFKAKNQNVVGSLHSPEAPTTSAIILIHGFRGNKDEHGKFIMAAENFCKAGFSVLRFDCRGSGESNGKFKDMTILTEVEDTIAAIDFVKMEVGAKKVGILGLSLGGEIAILTALEKEVDALVLWAPVTSSKKWKSKFTDDNLKELKERGFVETQSTQTRKIWKVGKGFVETAIGTKIENELEKIDCPTLIVHGDADKAVPLSHSQDAISKIKVEKRLEIIEGETHYFQNCLDDTIGFSLDWFKTYL
ncbi:MAG: alpha/beta hydrolase [Candidatus Altiarchaeota archaeon]|nr:alpha/beta hydrolase [Candidatus Altiarchaeota archaeon]